MSGFNQESPRDHCVCDGKDIFTGTVLVGGIYLDSPHNTWVVMRLLPPTQVGLETRLILFPVSRIASTLQAIHEFEANTHGWGTFHLLHTFAPSTVYYCTARSLRVALRAGRVKIADIPSTFYGEAAKELYRHF